MLAILILGGITVGLAVILCLQLFRITSDLHHLTSTIVSFLQVNEVYLQVDRSKRRSCIK